MIESASLIPLILVLFVLFFVGLWCFVLFILSHASGWRRLAGRFEAARPFRGELLRFQSARLNWVNFRSALEIGADERGLYLVPMVLFRVFHRPLLIPWSEIEAEPFDHLILKGQQLTFRSYPQTKLRLYGPAFAALQAYLPE